ncbi:hypothetical protein [Natronorubrum sediminis]|nr:hypothetical protein [Natronorubrum sediminis]
MNESPIDDRTDHPLAAGFVRHDHVPRPLDARSFATMAEAFCTYEYVDVQ